MSIQSERVVIIDDLEDMRFFLGLIFDEAGYEVHLAEDGATGLQLISDHAPTLIVSDLKMPGLSGWDIVDRLRAAENHTPIILVSGAQDEITRGALGPPIAGFLLKPFRVDEVLQMARETLSAHRARLQADERRREPRRSLVIPGRLLARDGQAIAVGTIVNLSRGGTRFDLGLAIEPGRTVRIALDVPGVERPLAVEGEIRWSREGALGIQFGELTSAQIEDLEALLGMDAP